MSMFGKPVKVIDIDRSIDGIDRYQQGYSAVIPEDNVPYICPYTKLIITKEGNQYKIFIPTALQD